MSDRRRPPLQLYEPQSPVSRFKMRLAATSRTPSTFDMIKITVGPDANNRDFHVNTAFLVPRADYFVKMLRNDWVEAEKKEAILSKQDPDIFAIYEKLIYFGLIPIVYVDPQRWKIKEELAMRTTCEKPDLCHNEYEQLVKLYLLADYLMDEQAKRAAVDAIKAKVKHESDVLHVKEPCMPSASALKAMWQGTLYHCTGRQVLLDCFVFYASCDSGSLNLDDVPVEIKDEVLWNLVKYRQRPISDMLYADARRDIEAVENGAVRAAQRKRRDSPMEEAENPRDQPDATISDGASDDNGAEGIVGTGNSEEAVDTDNMTIYGEATENEDLEEQEGQSVNDVTTIIRKIMRRHEAAMMAEFRKAMAVERKTEFEGRGTLASNSPSQFIVEAGY